MKLPADVVPLLNSLVGLQVGIDDMDQHSLCCPLQTHVCSSQSSHCSYLAVQLCGDVMMASWSSDEHLQCPTEASEYKKAPDHCPLRSSFVMIAKREETAK